MKKFLILIFVVFTNSSNAQLEDIIAFVNVKHTTNSGIEETKESILGMRTLLFLETENGIDLIDILVENETHSEGAIKNIKLKEYNTEEFHYTFDWSYKNNYDKVNNSAVVEFKISKSYLKTTSDKVCISIRNTQGLDLVYEGDLIYTIKPIVFYYRLEQCKK